MFSKRNLLASVALVVASLSLVGCSTGNGMMGGNNGNGNNGGMSNGDSPSASDSFNMADIQFTMMMIPHHKQAVEMSDMILAKSGIDPKVTDLAQQIRDAQQPEIKQMKSWLKKWNADMGSMNGDGMSGMNGGMNGMMSDDDMQALEKATGAEASRIFLEGMTEHHEGAIAMAADEIENGKDPDVIALAEEITSSQAAEIETMKELLAAL